MVAQFPEQTTTPSKNLTPTIQIDVNTFTNLDPLTVGGETTATRMCNVVIEVANIKKTLAVATFSRLFSYAQSLANNDINPIPNTNTAVITSSPQYLVSKPESGILINVDASELVPVCGLSLKINNLRLDYMDEYFNRTLTYLTSAISSDLNPDA